MPFYSSSHFRVHLMTLEAVSCWPVKGGRLPGEELLESPSAPSRSRENIHASKVEVSGSHRFTILVIVADAKQKEIIGQRCSNTPKVVE